MATEEILILVDNTDNQIGTAPKMETHEKGLLHRCFSIFVFHSDDNRILIQKRATSKYHSGGLWTNTCCGHPVDGEDIRDAAHRRLGQEMGFNCDLKKLFTFTYKAQMDKNLVEHEFDHVFIGHYSDVIKPSPLEADGYQWQSIDEIQTSIQQHPEQYTEWFKIAFYKVIDHLNITQS